VENFATTNAKALLLLYDTVSSKTNENYTTTNSEQSQEGRCFQFPVVSNEATKEINSVAVNKHNFTKQ